jgi:hypothetical protein
MFDSLDEEIKRDEQNQSTLAGRWLQYMAVTFISVFVFGGLYAAIRLLE